MTTDVACRENSLKNFLLSRGKHKYFSLRLKGERFLRENNKRKFALFACNRGLTFPLPEVMTQAAEDLASSPGNVTA
ncbi:hypothetical protein [Siccibacter turicensis]|uniref:hypothetical protein n=1 Tax=Siccibacter turicensis TaxID=357233 RepID=UPI0015E66803|nr:hypothetical protein [Siccibacter turicensis]